MSKVTMSANVFLTGSDGLRKLFNLQKQICYCEKIMKVITEDDVEKAFKNKRCYHYKVIENDIEYWIPGIYCTEYDKPFPVPEPLIFDKGEYTRKIDSNEDEYPDVTVLYKELFGREITNHYRPDYSKELINIINGNTI